MDGRVLIVSALNTISSNCTHPHWNILVEHATPVLWELHCHDNSVLSRVDKYTQDGIVGYLLVSCQEALYQGEEGEQVGVL